MLSKCGKSTSTRVAPALAIASSAVANSAAILRLGPSYWRGAPGGGARGPLGWGEGGGARVAPGQPGGTPAVAASRGSGARETMALSTAAASATVRPWGPTVSWVCEIGITPARLTSPTVGLMPTTPQLLAGPTMLPSVSVPMATAVEAAGTAAGGAGPGAGPVGAET